MNVGIITNFYIIERKHYTDIIFLIGQTKFIGSPIHEKGHLLNKRNWRDRRAFGLTTDTNNIILFNILSCYYQKQSTKQSTLLLLFITIRKEMLLCLLLPSVSCWHFFFFFFFLRKRCWPFVANTEVSRRNSKLENSLTAAPSKLEM